MKTELQIKKQMIFFFFSNLETSNVFIKMESTASYFFAVHRTVFSQHIKVQQLICHNLSLLCAVSHALVSAQIGFIVP